MKKVLITGGSHAELPIIRYAKEKGWFVITTGSNKDGLGHKEADKYVCGDFSHKEFVYNLALSEKVDGIISGCNDFAYLSTAYACDKLGLKGHDSYETASVIHHKDSFRELTASLGIKTPKVIRCADSSQLEEALTRLSFPVLVKPVDLTGGKGVRVCTTADEARTAFREAISVTREAFVILEEYIDGTNHGTSVVIKNGRILGGICDNELYYMNKYLVSGACSPSKISEDTIAQLYSDIEKIAVGLKLADGVFHTQFIVTDDGTPVIIDPCRRAPGDLYILLAKYSVGIDFPAVFAEAETGGEIPDSFDTCCRNIARVCVMTDRNGRYGGIEIPEEVEKHIIDKMIWAKDGEEIEDFHKYKAGILFLEYNSREELYDCFENFHERVKIKVI